MTPTNTNTKSLESWIWGAACSIRGAKDAPKYKDYILPLIFTKRLCDVFDDEINRIAREVGSRKKAFQLARANHKLVRFYLPLVHRAMRRLAPRVGGISLLAGTTRRWKRHFCSARPQQPLPRRL